MNNSGGLEMSENLRDEIEAALHRPSDERSEHGTPVCSCGHDLGWDETWEEHAADAVLAVVGPELDRLRAEVEADAHGMSKSARFEMLAIHYRSALEAAEAERDDLRAVVADLASALRRTERNLQFAVGGKPVRNMDENLAKNRAALASVPEPSDSEPAPACRFSHVQDRHGVRYCLTHVGGRTWPGKRSPARCDDSEPVPCRCHDTHAAITARHEGHCCFYPADRKCHPTEVEAWTAAHRALTEPAPDADREAGGSKPRLRACVEAWPQCADGEYNPACCRFPKSCSCTAYDPEQVTPEVLEDGAS